MKRILLLLVLGLLVMAPSWPIQQQVTHRVVIKPAGDFTDMNNPASMHCVDQGHQLVFREDTEGNQYGVCVSGSRECDEWDYFNGLCFLEPKCPDTAR